MARPFKADDERLLRVQIESEQRSLNESFALIVKRLREKADEIERQTMRAAELGLDGNLAAAHRHAADAILNEIAWLAPNLPTAPIMNSVRCLVGYEAILQQMGVLVTDEERAADASLAEAQALVARAKAMIAAGLKIRIRDRNLADVGLDRVWDAPGWRITYRLAGQKTIRTAVTSEIHLLRAASNPCAHEGY